MRNNLLSGMALAVVCALPGPLHLPDLHPKTSPEVVSEPRPLTANIASITKPPDLPDIENLTPIAENKVPGRKRRPMKINKIQSPNQEDIPDVKNHNMEMSPYDADSRTIDYNMGFRSRSLRHKPEISLASSVIPGTTLAAVMREENHAVPELPAAEVPSGAAMAPDIQEHVSGIIRYSSSIYAASPYPESGRDNYLEPDIFKRAEQLKQMAAENGYNSSVAFLIDMEMKSGRKRFLVLDLETMEIIHRGIVAHGKGKKSPAQRRYSNEPGSLCTSLGIYRIGNEYQGMYGRSFRLHGLESSNSNAYKRAIVLHAMKNIPQEEIDLPIFQSEGCPSVSPGFFSIVSNILRSAEKPVLMWIYDASVESGSSSQ